MATLPNENAIHTTIRAIVDGSMRMDDLYGYFGSKKEALEYYAGNIDTTSTKNHLACNTCELCTQGTPLYKVNFSWKAITDYNIRKNIPAIILASFSALSMVVFSHFSTHLAASSDVRLDAVNLTREYLVCRPCFIKTKLRRSASELISVISTLLIILSGVCFLAACIWAMASGISSSRDLAAFFITLTSCSLVCGMLIYTIFHICPKIFAPRAIRRLAPSPFKLDNTKLHAERLQ